jgi:hypothetical protein
MSKFPARFNLAASTKLVVLRLFVCEAMSAWSNEESSIRAETKSALVGLE